ncbi:MAG: GDP-mannose 4,6-dehydratase, partial [Candidatus Methanomethyliaceae archaeon]
GIIPDLLAKLAQAPAQLEVLGNGKQRKSYLHVYDCVSGMMIGWQKAQEKINIFNLGTEDDIFISRIAEIVLEESRLSHLPIAYTGGEIGWPGDVPQMQLDCRRIQALGWTPRYNSEEAVREAVRALLCRR